MSVALALAHAPTRSAATDRDAGAQSAPARSDAGGFHAQTGLPRLLGSLLSIPPTPQRKCAACEDEEKKARPRRDDENPAPARDTVAAGGLDVGPADDRYEREADAIALETLAGGPPVSGAAPAHPAPLRLQRKCGACAKEDEATVRPRAEGAETAPRLGADAGALTRGGEPLPEATRGFFEDRMGRDLSRVRVHRGASAEKLNSSISSHAFTYGSHIWLGRGERPDTGFTMAHELAHVLQQTQPGEVRTRAAAPTGGARVQRRNLRTFWVPTGTGTGGSSVLRVHEARHDAANLALAGGDASIITEAPMPGSTKRQRNRCDVSGFADLYKANPAATIGVIRECPSQNTGVPLKDFDQPLSRAPKIPLPGGASVPAISGKQATVGSGGKNGGRTAFSHAANRAPVLNGDEVQQLDRAPRSIQIGDMKPGHNEDERKQGVTQIENHIATALALRDEVNAYPKREGNRKWGLTGDASSMKLTGLKPPAEWSPLSTSKPSGATYVPSIELRSYSKVVPSMAAGGTGSAPNIEGRWVASEDPHHPGVYVYYLLPEEKSLKAALAGKDPHTDRFARVQERLKTLVLDPLVQPLPMRRGVRSTPDAATPRRAPPKGGGPKLAKSKKPPPKPFDLKAWNLARVGPDPVNPGDSFKGVFLKNFPADQQAAMEFRGLAAESLEVLAEKNGPNNRKAPNAAELIANFKKIEKFQFWSGKEAGVIGVLRRMFGGLFVKAVALGEKIKTWFETKLEKWRQTTGKGPKNAALRFGARVLQKIGAEMLDRTFDAVVWCIESGFQRTFGKFVDDAKTSIDELFDLTATIETYVAKAEAAIDAKINQLFAGYQDAFAKVTALLDDVQFVGKLIGVAKKAIRMARLAVCAAGAAETGGLSCAVSLIDEILSWVDLSPSEYLADLIMESCPAQMLFAEAMAASTAVQNLPKEVAKKITDTLRDFLPDWAKDFICTEQEMAAQIKPYDAKDYPCDPPPSGGGGGGSSGGARGKSQGGGKSGGQSGGQGGGESGGESGGQSGGGSKGEQPDKTGKRGSPPGKQKPNDGAPDKKGGGAGKPPPAGGKPDGGTKEQEDSGGAPDSGATDSGGGAKDGGDGGYTGEPFRPPEGGAGEKEEGPASEGGEEEQEPSEGEQGPEEGGAAPGKEGGGQTVQAPSGGGALSPPDAEAAKEKPEGGGLATAEPRPVPADWDMSRPRGETRAVIVGGLPSAADVDPEQTVSLAMTFYGERDGQLSPVVTVYGIDVRVSFVSEPDAQGLVRFRLNTLSPFYVQEIDTVIHPMEGEQPWYEGYAQP